MLDQLFDDRLIVHQYPRWEPRQNFPVECRLLESFWSVARHQERVSMYLYIVASQEWIGQ